MSESIPQQEFIDNKILTQGMSVQLEKWKGMLASGSERVGWKIGFNTEADQQRMQLPSPIVGFITGDSVLDSGDTYKSHQAAKLLVEAEIAILMGKDVPASAERAELVKAIEGFAPAIEIVDVARTSHDITSIIEDNIFHETVIFGEVNKNLPELSAKDISAQVLVNNQVEQSGDHTRYPDNLCDIVSVVADTLAKQGECLQAGDWIISGSITQPFEIHAGDYVEVSLSPLGSLSLNIA